MQVEKRKKIWKLSEFYEIDWDDMRCSEKHWNVPKLYSLKSQNQGMKSKRQEVKLMKWNAKTFLHFMKGNEIFQFQWGSIWQGLVHFPALGAIPCHFIVFALFQKTTINLCSRNHETQSSRHIAATKGMPRRPWHSPSIAHSTSCSLSPPKCWAPQNPDFTALLWVGFEKTTKIRASGTVQLGKACQEDHGTTRTLLPPHLAPWHHSCVEGVIWFLFMLLCHIHTWRHTWGGSSL